MPVFVLYELVCKDPTIKDKYLGYTSSSIEDFWLNQNNQYRDKTTGEVVASKQVQTPLQIFIKDTGGVDNWNFIELDKFDSSTEANAHKFSILQSTNEYTINTYYTDKKRAPKSK